MEALWLTVALMETLSYSLNVQVGDIKTSGTIIERERTLKNLRSKAKLAQEEQGTNTLYLCFGFIYWREHERESSPWLKAPLLMMPVSLLVEYGSPKRASKNTHRYRWVFTAYHKPIGQALAPYHTAGCCAVNELVSRALFIG